jgi:hypothetical protein
MVLWLYGEDKRMPDEWAKVVIVDAGFGGIEAAKSLRRSNWHDVTYPHVSLFHQNKRIAAGPECPFGGLASRVSPVHTALRNRTRDEGRSFEVGNQVLISSHRKLL